MTLGVEVRCSLESGFGTSACFARCRNTWRAYFMNLREAGRLSGFARSVTKTPQLEVQPRRGRGAA